MGACQTNALVGYQVKKKINNELTANVKSNFTSATVSPKFVSCRNAMVFKVYNFTQMCFSDKVIMVIRKIEVF